MPFDPARNYERTRREIGYVSLAEVGDKLYTDLGFKSGLEIHQQLKTRRKLFCRCPAGLYQDRADFDAEVVRHMRPTLSEMGEYDGTALMERKTRKNIFYRLKNETACTYDIDDTPPFLIDQEALGIAVEIALLLRTKIVGELHITRKQYLDGSIPTGFQRTGIVGIEGEIPFAGRKIGIIQLSIEEDSCREVSDIGHNRIYTTDRLGMPLIEMVTDPDMKTPQQVAEVAQYLRFLARSTDHVRVGIGAARQDVNVSIADSTRIEIKGVAHIKWIPILTHNEAFRQKSLLLIRDKLSKRGEPDRFKVKRFDITMHELHSKYAPLADLAPEGLQVMALNLPNFGGVLSTFTQSGQTFANELSGRLKVIACLEHPNMIHSEQLEAVVDPEVFKALGKSLNAAADDAQVIIWGDRQDLETATETIEERCRMAFEGVPSETRKARRDGTTIFERVLPGPDRMYPDTDSAPIAIQETLVANRRKKLPVDVSTRMKQLNDWKVPSDCHHYLLRNNLAGLMKEISEQSGFAPKFIGTLFGHTLKHIEGRVGKSAAFSYEKVGQLLQFLQSRGLQREIAKVMLEQVYLHPNMDHDSVLTTVGYVPSTMEQLLGFIPVLNEKFNQIRHSTDQHAYLSWIMGDLRSRAIGNVSLKELKNQIERAANNG